MRRSHASMLIIAVVGFLLTCAAGCEEQEIPFLETKRVDELLTDRDISIVADVLESVTEADRNQLVESFLPAPSWTHDRTLPIRELIATEQEAAERQRSLEFLSDRLARSPTWTREIGRRGITIEQYCGLFLSVTAAIQHQQIDPKISLPDLVELAELKVQPLELDERTFSSLNSEEQYALLYVAAWLAIGERAKQLSLVPDENIALVDQYRGRLAASLPKWFLGNVFDGLYPRPQDYGVPFNEGELSDAALSWSETDAIIGNDSPDDERTALGE